MNTPRTRHPTDVEVIGGPVPHEARLAHALVALADTFADDEAGIVELLSRLADECVDLLDVSAAGVLLAEPDGHLRLQATSTSFEGCPRELFDAQAEEGPGFDSFSTGRPVINCGLQTADERWPRFAVHARAAGFQLVHALPMRHRDANLGALSLFEISPTRFRHADLDAGQALADVATIAVRQHRAALEARQINVELQAGLGSRILIEQAKGMIAQRESSDLDEAFRLLNAHARGHNRPLVEVAALVVAGGHLTPYIDRLAAGPSTYGAP